MQSYMHKPKKTRLEGIDNLSVDFLKIVYTSVADPRNEREAVKIGVKRIDLICPSEYMMFLKAKR